MKNGASAGGFAGNYVQTSCSSFVFFPFLPSGPVSLLRGAGESPGRLRHLAASVRASAGGGSSGGGGGGGAVEPAKNKTTGPQWDGASRRHTAERRRRRTLPRRWKLLSTASRGAFQFCWRNKQRFEATPRVAVSPCLKTTGAGYYYVTQCCFCLFRFVQPVFRLFIHARLFCFAFGLAKKKKFLPRHDCRNHHHLLHPLLAWYKMVRPCRLPACLIITRVGRYQSQCPAT